MYTLQNRTIYCILCVVFFLFFVSLLVCADDSSYPKRVAIASSTPGGGYYMAASALAKVLKNKLPEILCSVEVTNASKHNMQLIQAGMSQIGLTVSNAAWEGWNGVGSFKGAKTDKLRTVFPHYSTSYMYVTLERTGIKDIKEFNGKRFSAAMKNSSLDISSGYLFEILGIQPKIVNLPIMDSSRSLVDGTIDGFVVSAPETAVAQLELTHDVRILSLSEKELDSFMEKYPQFQRTKIDSEVYKSIDEDIETFGNFAMWIVNEDISEDFVYDLCKAAFESIEDIALISPAMARGMRRGLDLLPYTPIPYHPGAIRYFREQGGNIPSSLIPPEMEN